MSTDSLLYGNYYGKVNNSERFQGRNLALRLLNLGYTEVYWYRGGREAWEVAGLPETELVLQDW
jgi:adenylate cyclase